MTTTRSQVQALAPPQGAPAPHPAENNEANPPQGNPLATDWIHATTNLMGFPLTSETGQKLQKWVLYQNFFKHTHLVVTWDPIEFEVNSNYQKYQEPDGTFSYLHPNLVKQLVGLRNYMLILMDKSRPTDQHENTFYYLLDERWTNLTAHDMRTALVNVVLENHRSKTSPGTPMSHVTSPATTASVRSPVNSELASFKKSIKREASTYSVLKDECYFDKFQRDLYITAKSHDVSEILDPNFTPGPSPEEEE